ncbi:methyl-accepting chemotaxis protein [Marinilabiliaceae bacterium JC017]|nr:methyl-accepting chemotaxis protein [Marinilabiliaceae bacterium JC017]
MKYRTKIQLSILSATVIIYVGALGYFLWRYTSQTTQESKRLVNAFVRESAQEIRGTLNVDFGIARSLAYTIKSYKSLDESQQWNVFSTIISNIHKNTGEYVSVWSGLELKVFQSDFDKPQGWRSLTSYKVGDEFGTTDQLINLDGNKPSEYDRMAKSRQEAIWNPYWYSLTEDGDNNVLVTSVCVPILEGDKYLGIAGADIALDRYQAITDGIKPYPSSVAYLLSNNGKFVTSSVEDQRGETFVSQYSDIDSIYHVSSIIQEGKESAFMVEQDGEEYYYSFQPVVLGKTTTPWSLLVVTPYNEIVAAVRATTRIIILIGLLGMVILFLILRSITNNIVNFIMKFSEFAGEINAGNLNARLEINRTDEIGDLAHALRGMTDSIWEMASGLYRSSADISNTSNYLLSSSEQLSDLANRQAASVEEVASSMEEMAANIAANTDNARKTEEIARNANSDLAHTVKVVVQANDAIQEIVNKISVVSDIAFQTNILALNAAVEASRAGDAGRGFSVVAAEVRKLAEKSRVAADDITKSAKSVLEASDDAKQRVEKLMPEIIQTTEYVREITTAGLEQNNGASQINISIQEINESTQQNAAASSQLSSNAADLTRQSEMLKAVVRKFKL